VRVAVTGAGGFIGAATCRRLAADGHDVVGLDLADTARGRVEAAGAEFRRCDVTALEELRQALSDADGVIHAAAIVSDWGPLAEFERVNVGGTRNVLEAAAGAERIVHVSSVAVWGYEFTEDITDEDEPPKPCGMPYIDTKGRAEQAALAAGATVVRPGDVYGPESVPWTIRPLDGLKRGRLRLPGRGEGLITPVYVDDLTDCFARALTRPDAAGRAFTAWDGHAVTTAEFFSYHGRMLGKDRLPTVPRPVAVAAAWVAEQVARVTGRPPTLSRNAITLISRKATYPNARARELLGWEPRVSLEEGMRRTEAWAREAGLLA
jgi:nucleoside-diphosphate-sugar epimerase